MVIEASHFVSALCNTWLLLTRIKKCGDGSEGFGKGKKYLGLTGAPALPDQTPLP
jgi:hypothetical protein